MTTCDLNDRLGTASRQTDTSATTTATRTYDAFGMLLARTGTPKGPFGFAGAHGYQEDSDSGLKLLGHRYYDASTGRFLTRDPAQEGRNWFIYCDSNTLSQTDASGLQGEEKPPRGHRSKARPSTSDKHTKPRSGDPEKGDKRRNKSKQKNPPTQGPDAPCYYKWLNDDTIRDGEIVIVIVIIGGHILAPEIAVPAIIVGAGAT